MEIAECVYFIKKAISISEKTQTWADLGCGSGVFTLSLARLLPAGSIIYAIDKVSQQIPDQTHNGVHIYFIKSDIAYLDLNVSNLDGIIMANALHYMENQYEVVCRLGKLFKEKKQFILIEYDTSISNQWVPYPIPFSNLNKLFPADKYDINKKAERKSIYEQNNMYCALITTKNN
ncbi:MAG: class I SAM-dependent methyltransferase [Sphingobacterium composti]